ncbi:MAG: hypothetical protein WCG10_01375 [Chlamydiota bacterium]
MNFLPKKGVWGAFFLLSSAVTLWFCVQASLQLIPYWRLSEETHGYIDNFLVQEITQEKYAVRAFYHYQVGDQTYKGETTFKAPIFLNPAAAKQHIEKYWNEKEWDVWYSLKTPSYASLQKLFPFKAIFNAVLSVGVLFYFVWLRSYVAKMS